MVQTLLILKVLSHRILRLKTLFCGASPDCVPSLFFSNNLFNFGVKPLQDDLQHDFTWVANEADGSEVLAELFVAFKGV